MTDSVIIKIVNLTDTERRIAYNYEMQMCRIGKINGVNSQISNILKQAGVDTSSITKDCTFTVDPYSYEITVDGVDEETKVLMQNALNVGNNGKNPYKHIIRFIVIQDMNQTNLNQLITYQYEANNMNRQWYSVLQKYAKNKNT